MNIINIEHISKIFGEKVIFEDASFGIQQGDKIGIVGINGTGKSTVLRMIAGEEEPDQGQIIRQNGLKIAYLPQSPHFPKGATVASYVLSGNGDKDWLVQSNMTKLGIEVSEQEVENLSGGQRRKLALAKVLAGDFDVLLLDEPTNHLDEGMINWLEEYLKGYKGVLVMVTHDRYFLDRTVNRIFAFEAGGVVRQYEGGYTDYLEAKARKGQTLETRSDMAGSSQNETPEPEKKKSSADTWKQNRKQKLKFTYKEQKEFETIDDDIAALEDRLEQIDKEMAANATNAGKLRELSEEQQETQQKLDEKMDRWVYLNDLAEQIEAQKE